MVFHHQRPVCILMCACAWVLAFLFEFPNFVGWGDHYFDQKSQQVSVIFLTIRSCMCYVLSLFLHNDDNKEVNKD
ncbi:hypothetical protein DPMN_025589 [Dreissena polymorpha]|uniref:Uncharacterized protein n=1 Tax=Dreissena polymorpha TaxID=45954 RepID=A0A9D4RBZ6_DREPO|nr:hypothetical protein DPMN_025522 [Dreissena polymorpha]KAH3862619.1 hypothetical protein DPMN_025589 [Dreissena polymorpha]